MAYKAQDFIDNIPGTGGIISTIAKRVGCDWKTAQKWIMDKPTVAAVYDAECERIIDTAEGVVYGNIQAAVQIQQWAQQEGRPKQVDSTDAKWLLSRKGKGRGYAQRQEITGADGDSLSVRFLWQDGDSANSDD